MDEALRRMRTWRGPMNDGRPMEQKQRSRSASSLSDMKVDGEPIEQKASKPSPAFEKDSATRDTDGHARVGAKHASTGTRTQRSHSSPIIRKGWSSDRTQQMQQMMFQQFVTKIQEDAGGRWRLATSRRSMTSCRGELKERKDHTQPEGRRKTEWTPEKSADAMQSSE